MRKLTLKLSVLTVLALAFIATASANADSLVLTLSNPVQNGAPGSTLDFTATALAPSTNGATVFLAGDSSNVDFPLTIDDNGFFNNFPFTLDPGDSFTGLLFTVTLPSDTPLGSYTGFFSIQDDSGAILGTANFQVNATPEPGTLVLFATGLSGLSMVVRRRRSV